jgi:hypothetical protein
MPTNAQAGIRRTELHFARETFDSTGDPQTPTDPSFLLYSSVFDSTDMESNANWEEATGIGNVVPQEKYRRQESHNFTVSYDLQQFPVDTNGNPQDAIADAALRDVDNRIESTHSILETEKKSEIIASNTLHAKYITNGPGTHPTGSDPGAVSRATRLTTYGRGGVADEPEISVNPSDTAVVGVELPYTVHKLRQYQIDQPESEYLHLRSTDSTDTGADIDIESVGATTTETVTLDTSDATTTVGSANTYSDLRAVRPVSELSGTLEVYGDDGSGSSAPGNPTELLTLVHGANHHDGVEGDRGVPLLGSGGALQSESALSPSDAELTTGSNLTWDGDPAAEQVQGTTISITNEIQETNTDAGLAMDIRGTSQAITASSTIFGETEVYDALSNHLEGREGELRMSINSGDIVIPRAYIRDAISASREEEQAYMSPEVTFSALAPSDGSDPLQFIHA